jgi:hypothetical protein
MTGVRLTGGCQCGACRYEISAAPLEVDVCHCRECRKQSASAFGITVVVPAAAFRITQGAPSSWTRPTDSGHSLECRFCPTCGSRIVHVGSAYANEVFVKGGSLDEPVDLSGAIHIWTSRRLPGVVIPEGAKQFPRQHDGYGDPQ